MAKLLKKKNNKLENIWIWKYGFMQQMDKPKASSLTL